MKAKFTVWADRGLAREFCQEAKSRGLQIGDLIDLALLDFLDAFRRDDYAIARAVGLVPAEER